MAPVEDRGESRASQVSGSSYASVPWSRTPPGTTSASPRKRRLSSWPYTVTEPLGTREKAHFVAGFPRLRRAHAYASPPSSSENVARLASDLPGWALIGRDFHPLDDLSEFHEAIATSFPSDQNFLVARRVAPTEQVAVPAQPRPSPDPDKEISTIRLLR